MKIFPSALLLLVQLSLIYVNADNEAPYKCTGELKSYVTVKVSNAQLTNGCILNDNGIKFDIKAMSEDAAKKTPKTPVVIDISHAAFIDSYINLINADKIPVNISDAVPLLFTMSYSNMSGKSNMQFGTSFFLWTEPFKLPPHSRIRIIHSMFTILSTVSNSGVFTFYGFQLVKNSSMEIAHNVITMEYINGNTMTVFYLTQNNNMKISDKSSFTIHDNKITMEGHTSTTLKQYVWFQLSFSPLTISETSIYTFASNIISMVGYNVTGLLNQSIWHQSASSPLTISDSSKYTWEANNISMVGYDVGKGYIYRTNMEQFVWAQSDNSPLTISETSIYTFAFNIISMVGYNVTGLLNQFILLKSHSSPLTISDSSNYTWESNNISMVGYDGTLRLRQYIYSQYSEAPLNISQNSILKFLMNIIRMEGYKVGEISQHVWYTLSLITITAVSQFLFDTNKILMVARDYRINAGLWSFVMAMRLKNPTKSLIGSISDGSSMVWRDNCVGMVHKATDKRHVFTGKWTIVDGGALLLDGNYFTTTDVYDQSVSGLTELVWDPIEDTDITIRTAGVTIRNTTVHANSNTGDVSGSMVWSCPLFPSKTNVKPTMDWSTTPAMGRPIPTIDNSNIQQYMCGIPNYIPPPPRIIITIPESATAVLSTIPGVLITSLVFLYLYNW